MGTHPSFESDFDCLTEHMASSLSPRTGLQESNGRAVISALRTLQAKIRSMESNKTQTTHETGTNTPRESTMTRKISRSKTSSICSGEDAESGHSNPQASNAQTTSLVQISRSKELERELSLADERCRLLEERLDHIKRDYAHRENFMRSTPVMATPVIPMPSCRSPVALTKNDENMELDEINFKFRLSPRSTNGDVVGGGDENNSVYDFNEKMRQLELDEELGSEFEVVRTTKKKDEINVKVQKKKIPFCAGKSATPSHNVGLNIQGLMHQLKTKNQTSDTRPRSATTTPTMSSSKGSTRLTDEIANLRKLLADLQAEFGEITLSCRRTELDVDVLQTRLESLEKKGQQVLVIKKLLKKKEEKLRNENKSIASSSDGGTISSRQRPSETRGRQNRQLLREVKKITNQI